MAFELKKKSATTADSPESLFRDLRGRTVEGLLAHQADLLRDYVQHAVDHSDVALQSPTGSGKTLVGLLIAEWRRRRFGERAVYLCPTNQLVHQVAAQARNQYGIQVVAFTGKKSEYADEDKSVYAAARSIAITSYSSLFNLKPFFQDPELIILDDAHSAENYIASAWSFHVDRRTKGHRPIFTALAGVVKSVLSATDYDRLIAERAEARWDDSWVDSVPGPALYEIADELTGVVDANVSDAGDLRYRWAWLKGHLDACQMYVARGEILIRPLIPPTENHRPFAGAKQRVYMSATLGAGGDLERITGRRQIKRLAVPAGWDKQGVGRRLFLFPAGALRANDLRHVVGEMAMRAGRSVILTTDLTREQNLAAMIQDVTGFPTFSARELEETKGPFVEEQHAVAVIANRYDGIDFPGDECRLLMIDQLPTATNLQERFFATRVGASVLLSDRVMTRLVQGFGRCTRSATDYAAVVIIDESVFTHLAAPERRKFLHPELQAELEFGIDQSIGRQTGEFLDNFDLFLKQEREWREADAAIIELREGKTQAPLPGSPDLMAAVPHEIDYQYAIWSGRYSTALDAARSALGALRAPELRGYRALWHYLAGNAAWLAARHGQLADEAAAREQYDKAARAVGSLRWLSDLARYSKTVPANSKIDEKTDSSDLEVIERLEAGFERLGSATNFKFDEAEARILEGLLEPSGKGFEAAHMELGSLLGYEAGKVEADASPDPWWRASDSICFVFEDHASASDAALLDAAKARQAATHDNWIRQNVPLAQEADVIKVLITPATRATTGAMPHLGAVLTWPLEKFRVWARDSLATLRELKRTYRERGDLDWQAGAIDAYQRASISPSTLKQRIVRESASVEWKVE